MAVTCSQNPEPQRKRAREFSTKSYKDNPEPKKLNQEKDMSKTLTLKRKWH